MPILNLTMRSQDLDGGIDANNANNIAKKTFNLQRTFRIKYLKLLHIYHNMEYSNLHSEGDSEMANTILFARISFLNGANSVFYENLVENNLSRTREHQGMICLGSTIDKPATNVFKDMFKVLHDGKDHLYINNPFSIELFKLDSRSPDVDNTDLATYNATASHLIVPITQSEFRGALDSNGQMISFIFEYQEDMKK